MMRTKFFARTALGLALAMGVAAGTASPVMAKDKDKPAEAPKLSPSKAFIPVYQAAKTALDAGAKRPDVMAAQQAATAAAAAVKSAQGKSAKAAAQAKYDAAAAALPPLLTAEMASVDKAAPLATNGDDKYLLGQLQLSYGKLALDNTRQRTGIQLQLDSGRIDAASKPTYLMVMGNLAMEQKDYAAARAAYQAASAAGSAPGDALISLADAYIKDNQVPAGLKVLQDAVVKTGATAPEGWMKYGIATSYRAKLPGEASMFANELVRMYPTKDNWALAVAVVRDLNGFQGHDQIALLRLMQRTNSFTEERDYVEYIQALSKRGLPGEALKIIDQGVGAGLLKAGDQFVVDARKEATTRVANDKASLPAQDREAHAANATAATVTAAADTFLSYDQPAKAEELYKIALTKPGVETARVNLQLGIAQSDQSKWADAQASFGKVTDSRAPIAQLWAAYAMAKAAGK
ncbi:MAG: hypothetical protein ACKOOL_05535 [Novosphingobium sp.]